MKSLSVALLAGIASALPQAPVPKAGGGSSSYVSNVDSCTDAILVIARGSTEPGNIGFTVGPALCKGLTAQFPGKFSCQGIPYPATILDNLKPKGTCDECIATAIKTFSDTKTKCPNAKLLFMGYSQGAALMHNTVPLLSAEVKKDLIGGVLFGDTKNKQSNTSIEGVKKEDLAAYCTSEDGVCWGGLAVTAGHLVYTTNGDTNRAINFLGGKIAKTLNIKPVTPISEADQLAPPAPVKTPKATITPVAPKATVPVSTTAIAAPSAPVVMNGGHSHGM